MDVADRLVEKIPVEVGEHVVVEQHAVPDGIEVGALRRCEDTGEILAREPFDDAGALVRRDAGQGDQRRREIDVRGDGAALPAAGMGRVRHDQRHVVLLAVRHCALGVQLVCAVHVAVVGS
jgi:hypothetical protein